MAKETAPSGRDASGSTIAPAPSAFDSLFDRQYARVTTIARRVLGDTQDAQDVAQDVFVEALRRHVADRPRPEAWLHAATVHTALNVLRSGRRRFTREQAVYRTDAATGSGATALDPADVVERAQVRRAVRAALIRLPSRQAAILLLRHSGLPYAHVAAALGLRPGSVGTLLHRAEVALRKELEHDAHNGR